MCPPDERGRGARKGLADEGVRGHVQRDEAGEPRPVGMIEAGAGAAIGQHRPLPEVVQEHDDRAGAPTAPSDDIDALGA